MSHISLKPETDWSTRLIAAGSGLKDSQHSGHRAAYLRPSNCLLLLGAQTLAGGVLQFAAQQTAAPRTKLKRYSQKFAVKVRCYVTAQCS